MRHAVDEALATTLGPGGAIKLEPTGDGTFFMIRDGARSVVRTAGRRRPPKRDVAREHRLLLALAPTPARAPEPIEFHDGVLVMQHVDGSPLPEAEPADAAGKRALAFDVVDALAELHAVDWQTLGFSGAGKEDGTIERQLTRTTLAFEENIKRSRRAVAGKRRRRLFDLEAVGKWLRARLPAIQEPTLCHGDAQPANVIVQNAHVAAIVDWEMWSVGDPITDLAWLLTFWRDEGDDPDPAGAPQPAGEGWPARAELVSRYEQRTGRTVGEPVFYRVFGLWRYAVLLESWYVERLLGADDDPALAHLEDAVPTLAGRALALIEAG